MHAFILATLMSASQTAQEVKTCKIDRVHSPVRNASIPRIRCVMARYNRQQEQETLANAIELTYEQR